MLASTNTLNAATPTAASQSTLNEDANKRTRIETPDPSTLSGPRPTKQTSPSELDASVLAILQRRNTLPSAGNRLHRVVHGRIRRHIRPSLATQYSPQTVSDQPPLEEYTCTPRGSTIKVDDEAVLKAALAHKESTPEDIEFPEDTLPEYDNLAAYTVPEETAREMIEREITRLIDIVEHPDRPLKFFQDGLLEEGTRDGYRALSVLSKRVMKAITICSPDNEAITMQYISALSSKRKFVEYMRSVRSGQASSNESFDSDIDESFTKASYSLVDYITAVLARHLMESGHGDYWHNNMLGVISKWTVKIKTLLLDLQMNSSISLRMGESMLEGLSNPDQSAADGEDVDQDKVYTSISANAKGNITTPKETDIILHCLHQTKFRTGPTSFIRYVLLSLQSLRRSRLAMTSYEFCAVVYETGFEGFKALLFQDRDFEFSATSDLSNLNVAHSAFSILFQTVTNLRDLRNKPPPKEAAGDLQTRIQWTYSEEDERNGKSSYDESPRNQPQRRDMGELVLYRMEDIVTVMVPLAATSPVVVNNINSFRNMVALTGDVDDFVRPYVESKFDAFFRMFTSEFAAYSDQSKVLQLSQAVRSGLFLRNSLLGSNQDKSLPVQSPQDETNAKKLRELTVEMDEWIYDENSVIVSCGFYVWSVIAAALFMVCGGLAIGFCVGGRLPGVDPFGITTYAWVLAAFFVLVCKSIQVEQWSWRDFLLRRVQCRCVSELHNVTGISEQLIMAKLLHDEQGTILNTRGPYNMVFKRKSTDGSGFSIDRPMNTTTLLLSGLTLLKVVTAEGYALVCLDARRGTDLAVVEHNGLGSEEHLTCMDISRPQSHMVKQSHRVHPLRLPLTQSKELHWKRVQGIYDTLDAVFV